MLPFFSILIPIPFIPRSVLSGHFGTDITRASVWPGINLTIQVMLRTGCASLLQSPTDFLTQATWCLGDDELFGHSK